MLSCRELVQKVASQGDEKLTLWERMNLRLHLAMCKDCRQYVLQLHRIGEVSREFWNASSADLLTLDRIRGRILGMLSGKSS
jgi:predicted anti-sigma-YlaC factor YlaD